MLNILYPTDFSNHSKEALAYAIDLTKLIDGRMHIISVAHRDVDAAKIQMNNLLSGLEILETNDNLICAQIIKGKFLPSIKEYVTNNDIDLVAMATLGNKDIENIVFGSETKKVASKLTIPLLAIPQDAKAFSNSEKIILALDNKIEEKESTFLLAKHIAQVLDLQIDIIHFEGSDEYDLPVDPLIVEYIGNSLGEVVVNKYDNFLEGIEDYSSKNNVGLIMMVRRPSGYLRNLLNFSNTTQELAYTDIPLMILPDISAIDA